ncbi:MAG: hypothetical protein M1820_000210 [Bogoriella megaspora]|nr:MAG: hypothetical protein M1820_000210 [Bogoriella megaspora]
MYLPAAVLVRRALATPNPFPSPTTSSSQVYPRDTTTTAGDWSSFIGIITAICGNILISFALNTQRYAHIRLERERDEAERRLRPKKKLVTSPSYGTQQHEIAELRARQNLNAKATIRPSNGVGRGAQQREGYETDQLLPRLARNARAGSVSSDETVKDNEKQYTIAPKSYLKSPYWWLGIVLMTIGEAGNFLAYGFAPASIVSPLGVVALISNCIIAPVMLKERFRWRDALGVVVSVGGAVTVVLSAEGTDPKLGADEIWALVKRWEFETYLGITIFLIIALAVLSNRYGHKTILVDIGLVGLFGGYTALSTKGVASLLSYQLWKVITFPITYILLLILIFTAIMQVKYVNRALQRFDSTQVIPTQFVAFTLSVIIGSAVLYRDFEHRSAADAGKFVGGCALTFLGVWLITSGRHSRQDESDEIGEEEDAINLVDEEEQRYQDNVRQFDRPPRKGSIMADGSIKGNSTTNLPEENPAPPMPRMHSAPEYATSIISKYSNPSAPPSAHSQKHLNLEGLPYPTNNPWTSGMPSPSSSNYNPQQTQSEAASPSRVPHPTLPTTASDTVVPTAHSTSPARLNTQRDPLSNINPPSAHSPYPQTPDRRMLPRASITDMFTAPLSAPLSGTLSAVVADELRHGVGSTRSRRGSMVRPPSSKRKSQISGLQYGQEPESPSVRARGGSEPEVDAVPQGVGQRQGDGVDDDAKRRSKSVGGTLEGLFRKGKKRLGKGRRREDEESAVEGR